MPVSVEDIESSIRKAIVPEFRGKLLTQGQARSMIWRDGILPKGSPAFSSVLSNDLLSFGYALLNQGIRLLELQGDQVLACSAFEHAADAIESVVAKGRNEEARDFHRLIAASAYHLGGFSARAYSLLQAGFSQANLSLPERCLALLMLRNLDEVHFEILTWSFSGMGSDNALVEILNQFSSNDHAEDKGGSSKGEMVDGDIIGVLDVALSDNFMAAMGIATLAFERGEPELLTAAIARLKIGLEGSGDLHLVPQWWCHRLAIYVLKGLWDSSFHQCLPASTENFMLFDWTVLRELFIASLSRRSRAEIELWPSQLEAATRALDLGDNMVVSLPTSAGKTRIAELCILACLATGKRIVFVTPLRALSAQMEMSLQRTFHPLGKTVSSLYGSIGVSSVDENILRSRDIIVATPEKLDFALRNDPTVLDDVGLIVLDEGHMIGIGEREVRYEIQIQRLLRRNHAYPVDGTCDS
jgi:hypothetical protein